MDTNGVVGRLEAADHSRIEIIMSKCMATEAQKSPKNS